MMLRKKIDRGSNFIFLFSCFLSNQNIEEDDSGKTCFQHNLKARSTLQKLSNALHQIRNSPFSIPLLPLASSKIRNTFSTQFLSHTQHAHRTGAGMVPTAKEAVAAGYVDPLSGTSVLSLFPRTIRASGAAPVPADSKDLDSIHNIMKSLVIIDFWKLKFGFSRCVPSSRPA